MQFSIAYNRDTSGGKGGPRYAEELRSAPASPTEAIAPTGQRKGWAGKIFGGSTLNVAGILAWITNKATAVFGAKDAVGGLGLAPATITWMLAAVVVLALVDGLGVLEASASPTAPSLFSRSRRRAIQRRKVRREFKDRAGQADQGTGGVSGSSGRDLDVHENVLRKWAKEFGSDPVQAFPGLGQMKSEQQERSSGCSVRLPN